MDPNIDPIIAQLCNADRRGDGGGSDSRREDGRRDQRDVRFLDSGRHYQAYHGGLRILSESASAKLATPITLTAG